MDIFAVLFYIPIYNVIAGLYHLLGDNLALSIVAIAIIFRTLTIPLTLRQIKFAKQNQEMQERLSELKKLHKNNSNKLKEEQAKLQQEYLPGQIAGCLPMILQFLVLSQIFVILRNIFAKVGVVFTDRLAGTEVVTSRGFMFDEEVMYGPVKDFLGDSLGVSIDTNFFGINLGSSAGEIGYADLEKVLPYILLAVLVAITQFVSNRILMALRSPKRDKQEGESKAKKKGADEPEDFGEIMQRSTRQTMYFFPILIGFFALNFPAGLGIYWTTQSAFVIIQQFLIEKLRKQDE